jgi:hypothetical protein
MFGCFNKHCLGQVLLTVHNMREQNEASHDLFKKIRVRTKRKDFKIDWCRKSEAIDLYEQGIFIPIPLFNARETAFAIASAQQWGLHLIELQILWIPTRKEGFSLLDSSHVRKPWWHYNWDIWIATIVFETILNREQCLKASRDEATQNIFVYSPQQEEDLWQP